MVCGKCGKVFDESAQATEGRCPFCKTVHTPEGDPIRELKGILSYIAQHFGEKTLLDRRRTDALIADIFPEGERCAPTVLRCALRRLRAEAVDGAGQAVRGALRRCGKVR